MAGKQPLLLLQHHFNQNDVEKNYSSVSGSQTSKSRKKETSYEMVKDKMYSLAEGQVQEERFPFLAKVWRQRTFEGVVGY